VFRRQQGSWGLGVVLSGDHNIVNALKKTSSIQSLLNLHALWARVAIGLYFLDEGKMFHV
jgi:hypothetical protein